MSKHIHAILTSAAEACDCFPDDFIGQTVDQVLTDCDHAPNIILWGLYNAATLATVIGWEHMSRQTMHSYALWFQTHGAIGQA